MTKMAFPVSRLIGDTPDSRASISGSLSPFIQALRAARHGVPTGEYRSDDHAQAAAIAWVKELGAELVILHPEIAAMYRDTNITCQEMGRRFLPHVATNYPEVAKQAVIYALHQLLTDEERNDLTSRRRHDTIKNIFKFEGEEWSQHCKRAWEKRNEQHGAPVRQLIEGRGQTPFSTEEKERLLALRIDPEYLKASGFPDYEKIANQLNIEFHDGKEIRTGVKVGNWSKDYFRKQRNGGWRRPKNDGS